MGKTVDLLLAMIAFTKEVFTCDRSICYANYTFKSTSNAIPILESAVITSTRACLSLEQVISTQNRCFLLTDLKCDAFRENVCVVLKSVNNKSEYGKGSFLKGQLVYQEKLCDFEYFPFDY